MRILIESAEALFNLFYPPLCMHCEEYLGKKQRIFCANCQENLIPIDPKERCPYCFSADFQPHEEKCCFFCRQNPPFMHRIAAVFDYDGPAATLINKLRGENLSYLSEGAGAYLAAQFLRLDWPLPDYIITLPIPFLRRLERGYNQSLLLAKVLGNLLERPVCDIIGRKMGDFSQSGLNPLQRRALDSGRFYLKKRKIKSNANLLVIDDIMVTGSSLNCCAEILLELYPKKIYGLTVCRTI